MLEPNTDLKAQAALPSSLELGFRYYCLRIVASTGQFCTVIGKLHFLGCLGSLLRC